MSFRFKIDTKGLDKGVRVTVNRAEKAMKSVLFKTGIDILDDSNNEAPKPPIQFGDLRGSGAVVVKNGPRISPEPGKGGTTETGQRVEPPDVMQPDESGMAEHSVRVSYNVEYALKLHESPNWKPREHPAAPGESSNIGHKWLETSLKKNIGTYRKKFADRLAKLT